MRLFELSICCGFRSSFLARRPMRLAGGAGVQDQSSCPTRSVLAKSAVVGGWDAGARPCVGMVALRPVLDLSEAVPHAIERLDHIELVVDRLELLAKALDVAVDRAIVHVDLLVIGRIHQRIAAFNDARPLG